MFFIGTINCLMFSCIPIIHIKYIADFQNLTQDTLIIGASNYNNIDSMKNFLWSGYDILNHNKFVIKDSIWKGFEMYKYIILPDSICGINEDFLFSQNNGFGGGGILPGAIIGGAIGGIAGSFGGSWIGTGAVDGLYGR